MIPQAVGYVKEIQWFHKPVMVAEPNVGLMTDGVSTPTCDERLLKLQRLPRALLHHKCR
jgi:hypothetical protein